MSDKQDVAVTLAELASEMDSYTRIGVPEPLRKEKCGHWRDALRKSVNAIRQPTTDRPDAGEREAVVRWLREQADKGAEYGIASDKGTTRRAAFGGGSLALDRAAIEIEQGAHLNAAGGADMTAEQIAAGDDDPIVGHKTFCDDEGNRWHEPLRQSEADDLWAQVEVDRARRERLMPTEADCLRMLGDLSQRLSDFGWRPAIYCPKDGSLFDAIEFGSTGIHTCHYEGKWPDGHWWVHDAGDLYPSRPVLFRLKSDLERQSNG